jgi:ribosomal protein L34
MIEPITTGGGRVTTHGALARADTGEKVMAMRRRCGCAPVFLTFAVDDVPLRHAVTHSSNN